MPRYRLWCNRPGCGTARARAHVRSRSHRRGNLLLGRSFWCNMGGGRARNARNGAALLAADDRRGTHDDCPHRHSARVACRARGPPVRVPDRRVLPVRVESPQARLWLAWTQTRGCFAPIQVRGLVAVPSLSHAGVFLPTRRTACLALACLDAHAPHSSAVGLPRLPSHGGVLRRAIERYRESTRALADARDRLPRAQRSVPGGGCPRLPAVCTHRSTPHANARACRLPCARSRRSYSWCSTHTHAHTHTHTHAYGTSRCSWRGRCTQDPSRTPPPERCAHRLRSRRCG